MPAPEKRIPLRVGIKYCGGCKPGYDRAEVAEQIKARLRGRITITIPDEEGVALILAVQGCPTACADVSSCGELPVWPITSAASADAFIAAVESHSLFRKTKPGSSGD